MRVICSPSRLEGVVRAIPSKSDAHRLLICAALADGQTELAMPNRQGHDIEATMRALRALGAGFEERRGGVLVSPASPPVPGAELDCGESGSTLRFLLPVAAALGGGARFSGSGRLPERPVGPLLEALGAGGVFFDSERLPLRVEGRLRPGHYALPGDVSSQFVTGLLLALPLAGGGEISLLHPLESAGYVDMTIEAMEKFSVSVVKTARGFAVPPGQRYVSPGKATVDGDWSNMAFFLAAGALRGAVRCEGLHGGSLQGDSAVSGLLARFGAAVTLEPGAVSVGHGALRALEIDAGAIPDLVPALAAVAASAEGTTRFYNAGRLRIKESDRIAALAEMLRALGGRAEETRDELFVTGTPLKGGTVDCKNDHRIAMAGAVAALSCAGETALESAEAVDKSYPTFFDEYKKLGGKCHVVHHG